MLKYMFKFVLTAVLILIKLFRLKCGANDHEMETIVVEWTSDKIWQQILRMTYE